MLLLIALFLQIWQNYAEGMSILALSLLARYCIKSTMMDLNPNKYGLQKPSQKFVIPVQMTCFHPLDRLPGEDEVEWVQYQNLEV